MRSRTESPCLRRAEVEILGVAFCGPCARQQEAYFAIGELTHEEAQGLRSEPLAEALERKRRERAGVRKLWQRRCTTVSRAPASPSLSRLRTANFTYSEGEGAGVRHLNLLPDTVVLDLDAQRKSSRAF